MNNLLGSILLLVYISHVTAHCWYPNILATDHTVHKSSIYQHVFSGFWQHQLHQMTVFLQHFNNGGQQISMYDNYFHQRDNYVFPRQQLHYLDIAWYLNIRMATKNDVSFQDTQRELILNTDNALHKTNQYLCI